MLPILSILFVLAIAGVLLWAIKQFPIDPMISKFITVVVIVVIAIWLLLTLARLLGITLLSIHG